MQETFNSDLPIPSKSLQNLMVAAVQMTSTTDLDDNLNTAKKLIEQAAGQGAQLIVLPEYFCLMGESETSKLKIVEKHGKGRIQQFLSEQAKSLRVWIVGGAIPIESSNPVRPFSRCYVFSADGNCVTHYDKIHLFDVNVDDSTGAYCESKYCSPGKQLVGFDFPWGKVGLAICYDIRFPELFRELVTQGVSIFLLPAAFTAKTGEAHWEVLIKARAIENQCFLVASAQSGEHQNGRTTWGHSSIVSPWGDLLAVLEQGEGVVCHQLDLLKQEKLRNEFPVLRHTRL